MSISNILCYTQILYQRKEKIYVMDTKIRYSEEDITLIKRKIEENKYMNNVLEITGVTLLPIEEAREVDEDMLKADQDWWLGSRGLYDDIAACVYGDDGYVDDYGNIVLFSFGVRPALKISNLEYSSLKIGDSITFGDHDFTILSDRYALCNDIIGECVFRQDWKAKDANEYEASDVKKYVDDWFIRIKERKESISFD